MKILIEELTFDCIIGILDFERETPQKVIINISFDYNFTDKSTFIDYSKVVNEIESIMKEKKFELLEDAILHIDSFLRNNYQIEKLDIKISKPNILTNCIVSLKNN